MPLLDLSAPLHTTSPKAAPPAPVTPIAKAAPAPSRAATDLLAAPGAWDWQALRDYVLRQMTERHIHYSLPAERLNAIFRSFSQRWGNQAERIARFAFEHLDGYWMDAPITPTRFTKGNDPYFAQRIADSLLTTAA